MSGSILNCSSGLISNAMSALVVVPSVLRPSPRGAVLVRPSIAHRRAYAGYGAVDVQHSGRNSQEEQYDHPPRPCAEPMVDRPAQRSRDADRDHQLDADAQAEAETLLHGRAVAGRRSAADALRPRLVDPLAKPRQRIRRPALAHSEKRNHKTPVPAALRPERGGR